MSPDEPNQGQAEPEAELPPHRLDPDLAAAAAGAHEPPRLPPPVIDTRRYRWMIGIFGFILVVAFSIYELSICTTSSPRWPRSGPTSRRTRGRAATRRTRTPLL